MLGDFKAALKIGEMLEKLMENSGLKQKFQEEGEISGQLQIENYDILFVLRRRE